MVRVFVFCFFLFVSSFVISQGSYEVYGLEVDVPSQYQRVVPGDRVWFTAKVLNLASEERVDITLKYSLISDVDGSRLVSKSETVAIETQASFVGSIDVPRETSVGAYHVQVDLISNSGNSSQSGVTISVVETESFFDEYRGVILSVGIGLFVVVCLWFLIPFVRGLNHRLAMRRRVASVVRSRIKKGFLSSDDLVDSRLPGHGSSKKGVSKKKR